MLVFGCNFFDADKIHSEALTVTRKHPTICYWSLEKIRYQETFEQEIGDTNLEDSDCDKDEDVSVEAYEPKLCKMLDSFERMNSKLNDAITKFPEKESFRIFNEKLKKKLKAQIFLKFQVMKMVLKNDNKEGNGEEDNDNDGSQLEVDYLLDGNEAENEGIKNDRDNNQKECETKVKEKNAEINENKNHEDTKETNNHGETSQQNETNQNLLDKVVKYIVDKFHGIGFSSLNSQEDEIWNDPEMKNILDNIDIGSPMTRSKTDTLISQTRGTHKMYINKEEKLRKEREMIQAREIMNMEIKEEHKLRRQKEKMEARESLKMKIKKEEKLTRQNEMKRGLCFRRYQESGCSWIGET
uniref:Uncharacterized protein n=1 Tax=Lactuca sativa TaxID=4236 RepID=A0A9R1XUR4_LACSA|nr:hypothetical protein LSAT_V11C100045170 [Lactuca sativa]